MANNFGLTIASSQSQIVQSLNYALANMGTGTAAVQYNGNVVVANSATGIVQAVTSTGNVVPGVIGYLYEYVDIQYSNSATGSSGFSSNCTLANYYGVRNVTTPVEDYNPVDYTWYQVVGGFGTTKGLWYFSTGNNNISLIVSTNAPTTNYSPVIDNVPILLASLAANIVYGNNIVAGTITNVQIANSTITSQNIQNYAIQALDIANAAITNAQIQLGTITGSLIQTQTITGNLISLNTITGNLVALNTITGNLIAQNTITGNLIVPGTIYGNAIVANTLNANAITANTFVANTINGNSIVAGSITTDKLAANA